MEGDDSISGRGESLTGSASPVGAPKEGDAVRAIAAIAIAELVAVSFIVIAKIIAKRQKR
jgi:hypothetical protein